MSDDATMRELEAFLGRGQRAQAAIDALGAGAPKLDRGEYENALIAAGALYAALALAGTPGFEPQLEVDVVMNGELATNQLRVRFPFLKSPYIVTVEREQEEPMPASEL